MLYINLVAKSAWKKRPSAGNAAVSEEELEPGGKKTDVTPLLQKPFVHLCLIAVVGFFVYANTFHGAFHWDDSPQIANNPIIKNLDNFISNTKGYRFNPRRFIGYLTFALSYYAGKGSAYQSREYLLQTGSSGRGCQGISGFPENESVFRRGS